MIRILLLPIELIYHLSSERIACVVLSTFRMLFIPAVFSLLISSCDYRMDFPGCTILGRRLEQLPRLQPVTFSLSIAIPALIFGARIGFNKRQSKKGEGERGVGANFHGRQIFVSTCRSLDSKLEITVWAFHETRATSGRTETSYLLLDSFVAPRRPFFLFANRYVIVFSIVRDSSQFGGRFFRSAGLPAPATSCARNRSFGKLKHISTHLLVSSHVWQSCCGQSVHSFIISRSGTGGMMPL